MSNAQNHVFCNDSLQAELSISEKNLRVGDTTKLTVTITIVDGDYIYALVPPGKPYLETVIETFLVDAIEIESDWIKPAGEFTFNDSEILVHQGAVSFTQHIKALKNINLLPVKVRLQFQCCNPMSCTMPVEIELQRNITIA